MSRISYSVNLVCKDDSDVYYYEVFVEDSQGNRQLEYHWQSENYNEVLFMAGIFFQKLSDLNIQVGSYVEQPLGRGAIFKEDEFVEENEIENEDKLYSSLIDYYTNVDDEIYHKDPNVLFRSIVRAFKLNMYQEQKLLDTLKVTGIL